MPSPRRATPAGRAPLLALDFDGVVVDALRECAAVTYFAGRDQQPRFSTAMQSLPDAFVSRFAQVRPYCRTLTDFMVTNHVTGPVESHEQFLESRQAVPVVALDRQAAAGEELRRQWRRDDAMLWLNSHHVHDSVLFVLQHWSGPRWIVSAKDPDSIRAILVHHGALRFVDKVAGSCDSKVAALEAAAATRADVMFLDDNLDHVLRANDIPGVTARWARWGYAAAEDDQRALDAGIAPLHHSDLPALTDLAGAAGPIPEDIH